MEFTIWPCNANFELAKFLDNITFTRMNLNTRDIVYFYDKISFDVLSSQFIPMDALDICLSNKNFCFEKWLLNGFPKTLYEIQRVTKYIDKKKMSKNKRFVSQYYNIITAEYLPEIIEFDVWLRIIRRSNRVSKIILKHIEDMDQKIIARRNLLSWDILLKHYNKFDFNYFITTEMDILRKLKYYINWKKVCKQKTVKEWTISFIEEHLEFIDLELVCEYKIFPMSFIERYIDKFSFETICRTQNLSVDFMKKYKNNLIPELLQINRNFNHDDTLQIIKNRDSWFIIELPYMAKISTINFATIE